MGEDAATAVRQHLAASTPSPVLGRPLAELDRQVMDWSMPDPPPVQVRDGMVFIGRYLEERSVYHTAAYETPSGERRTIHLGVDLFVPERPSLTPPLRGDHAIRARFARDHAIRARNVHGLHDHRGAGCAWGVRGVWGWCRGDVRMGG
ncbi:MAG: hypothetical protein IPK24_19825 [Kineosporiaceae bacterium]|nr:hypothetical protein [Kineosporiaceae bacterium]